MSYFLADQSGPLDEFASIGGLIDFASWARTQSGALRQLADDGFTEDLDELATLLDDATLRDGARPPDAVQGQVALLRAWAPKAEGVLIISDGFNDSGSSDSQGSSDALDMKTASLRDAGDVGGHPFHGNQWTGGTGSAAAIDASKGVSQPSSTDRLTQPLTTRGFSEYFKARGYKTLTIKQLPNALRSQFDPKDVEAVPPAVVEGIEQGLAAVKEEAPELHAWIQKNVPIMAADYAPADTAATVSNPTGVWLFVNGSKESIKTSSDITHSSFTIASRAAAAKGLTGDDYVRELYKGVIVHEVGHVADRLMGGQLTNHVVDQLLRQVDKEALPDWLETHLSMYAKLGGPAEATAEIVTAGILGLKLPPELDKIRDHILTWKKPVRRG